MNFEKSAKCILADLFLGTEQKQESWYLSNILWDYKEVHRYHIGERNRDRQTGLAPFFSADVEESGAKISENAEY